MKRLTMSSRSWWQISWDLYEESLKIGTLDMVKPFTQTSAEGRAHGEKWVVGYDGWSATSYYIEDGAKQRIATANSDWWTYKLAVTLNGEEYLMTCKNWWGSSFVVTDKSGREILTLTMRYWKIAAEIEYDESLKTSVAFPLMFLAFYRAKVVETQSAASGAGGGAIVATS